MIYFKSTGVILPLNYYCKFKKSFGL